MHYKRLLREPSRSFFLFGPRGVGKSTWLKELQFSKYFNLLENRSFLELSQNPEMLAATIGEKPPGTWVCIDEIQKIPSLLDEVHRLIEDKKWNFALSGSSARKLKRGGANLLAGRAITKNMGPLVHQEMGRQFNLAAILEWGSLPMVVNDLENAKDILSTYVHTYIKEEIREEGLVRKVEPFARFLEIAGLMNSQQVNGSNIARDAHISRANVDMYFSILEDTLLGHWLPAYRPRLKVRERAHPKFYWFDPGVARAAAGLLYEPPSQEARGAALETYFFHELRVYNEVSGKNKNLSHYRTPAGVEIDFIIEIQKAQSHKIPHVICIEVKSSKKWDRRFETPMLSLAESSGIKVKGLYGVYLGDQRYSFDGVEVMPVKEFLEELYKGKVY